MQELHEPVAPRCVRAFLDREYADCSRRILEMPEGLTHEQLQMVLICMHRLGGRGVQIAEQLGADYLEMTAAHPWLNTLLKLTLGQAEPAAVLAQATNDRQRCQVHYYRGTRLLTGGQSEAARVAFAASSAIDGQCLEWALACHETAFLDSTLVRQTDLDWKHRIRPVAQEAQQLLQQGRPAEALVKLIGATSLLRRHAGDVPDLAFLLNFQGRILEDQGIFEAAEPQYWQALAIRRKAIGGDPLEVQVVAVSAEAASYLNQCLNSYTICLNNLALLYTKMRKHEQAEPLARQAVNLARRIVGENHLDYATQLGNLAAVERDLHNFVSSESLFRETLGILRRVVGDTHPVFASTLENLAGLYVAMGQPTLAEPLMRQALRIYRSSFGERNDCYKKCLQQLLLVAQMSGQVPDARAESVPASATPAGVRGNPVPTAPAVSSAGFDRLNARVNELLSKGRYSEAVQVGREACDWGKTHHGEHHPDYAIALNNLGMTYRALGDYAQALPLLREARDIWRTSLGEHHPYYAASLNNLALLFRALGDYSSAEPLYRQALTVMGRTCGENHPDYAQCVHNLAVLFLTQGKLDAAEPLFRQALGIFHRTHGENHPLTAQTLNDLAAVMSRRGAFDEAGQLLHRVLELRRGFLPANHPDLAQSLNNLGNWHIATWANHVAAEPLFRQALAIRRQVLGPEHPEFSGDLGNLAVACVLAGREPEAVALLEEATALDDRTLGRVCTLASDAQRLAYLEAVGGNFRIFLTLALRDHTSTGPVGAALDLVLRRKALTAEVLAAQRDAVLSGRHPALESKFEELRELRLRIAQQTLTGPGSDGWAVQQQRLAEWDVLKGKLEAQLASQIPEMNLEQQLRAADRRAVALALPEGSALIEFVRVELFDFCAVSARGESFWQPAHYLAFVLPAGQPEAVQLIDLGEADPIDRLVAEFRDNITSPPSKRPDRGPNAPSEKPTGFLGWLFGSRKQDARGLKLYPRVEERPTESGTASAARLHPSASELRQRLFDPLVPVLASCSQLWLCPDGDLNRLPFEVLPFREEGKLLLDTYLIHYLASGRDVLRCGQPALRQPAPAVVAGDPDFNLAAAPGNSEKSSPLAAANQPSPSPRRSRDDARLLPVERLQGTRREAERIALFLGVEPVFDRVMDQSIRTLRSPHILHLATHGFFFEDQESDPEPDRLATKFERDSGRLAVARIENPLLRSGLLLAGFNTWLAGGELPREAEDGILSAEDVSGMDLLGTELVVLSACETGLGDVRVGEGVFGLRRAFAVAGAKTLVMSLWKVPDEQTDELMVDFYKRILGIGCERQPRAEALRQAQQALRTRDGGKYADPYYWGAFICQGDPGPLPK